MRGHVGIVVVHGIRTRDTDYANAFRRAVMRQIPRDRRTLVEWREVFWGDVTHGNQRAYFERATHTNWLIYRNARWEFVLQGLGDAASYIRTRTIDGAAYHAIQDRVNFALDQLDMPDCSDRRLIFVGHSLGCQIISSYVWDMNRLKQVTSTPEDEDHAALRARLSTSTPFRRLDTLAGIVTFGSNIPVFTFAFAPKRVIPITRARIEGETAAFPGCALPEDCSRKSRWINFYSPFDILGFPLKPLNSAYYDAVQMDKVVFSGGWRFWHPLAAHQGYWRHRAVVKHTARLVVDIIG